MSRNSRHKWAFISVAVVGVVGLAAKEWRNKPASVAPLAVRPGSVASAPPIGRRIEGFAQHDGLRDGSGRLRSLAEFRVQRLLVVAFLGVECPLAKLYACRLEQLRREFSGRGVGFLAIDANDQDSLDEIAAFARDHDLGFPMLRDADHRVADCFGAERTPEAFLLDENRVIRYCGRIDDQYAIGLRRTEPTRRDLAIALEELLDGGSVSVPVAPSSGCRIGRSPAAESPSPRPAPQAAEGEAHRTAEFPLPRTSPEGGKGGAGPTYSSHIASLLERRCAACHQEGQAAPFALTRYPQVAAWAPMIREVVSQGSMPPWFADPRHGRFANDARLTDDEKQLLLGWIDAGCPQGDASQPAKSPRAASDWRIGLPDQVLFMDEKPFRVPAEGQVDYQYYLVDPGFTEDKYLQAVEVRPGAPAVVHHALVSIARDGDAQLGIGTAGVLMNYAPGMQPTVLPQGTAIHVPAGAKFLFQMHYTPNGMAQSDRTRLGLVFADARTVKLRVTGGVVANPAIAIPAGAADHCETAERTFDEDVQLLSLSPHLHLRGKSFRFEALYPDGRRETLLDVPRYDYHWQLHYFLAEPKPLPAATRLRCTAHFDNSAANKANPDPTQTVRWGDQTWEEMLIGFYSVVAPVK